MVEMDEMSTRDDLTPQQIAELKRQLQAANARLIAVEHRRQELRDYIATLTDQLKRAESG
jgi:septal ring factor EnvC (AmiA/AmiB activator)